MKPMKCMKSTIAAVSACLCVSTADAVIALPAVFSDHMVLQRDVPLPVWGFAGGAGAVVVSLVDPQGRVVSEAKGPVGSDGRFAVKLPAVAASKSEHVLRVVAGGESIERHDVLVGEVWLCGGQSNMEWPVAASDGGAALAAALPQTVRFLTAPHELAAHPAPDIAAGWVVATPESTPACTAIGAFFAKRLGVELDMPIGLLEVDWGGSPAEAWVPANRAAGSAKFKDAAEAQRAKGEEYERQSLAGKQHEYDLALVAYAEAIEEYWRGIRASEPGFTERWLGEPADAAHGWAEGSLPIVLGSTEATAPLATFDGASWWRREVVVPSSWTGKRARIVLGAIDDSDMCFVNGVEIGKTTQLHQAPRVYEVPEGVLRAGANEIAILVLDTGGPGGFSIPANRMVMQVADSQGVPAKDSAAVGLAGDWMWKRGGECGGRMGPQPPQGSNHPQATFAAFGSMWNGMMAPVVPYAIRGAVWYQGESNADRADAYRELLPLLIASWRDAWGGGKFPFGIVQLAAFHAPSDDPVEGGWAGLRQAQLFTFRTVPATGLVVTTDVGDANDIHPRNKGPVGDRLADWALAEVYARPREWSGPLYRSSAIEGSSIVLSFDHAKGLAAKGGGTLDGFAIAGSDGKFVWGSARIDGERVIVTHPAITAPVAVRYAWSSNPVRANLVNASGLPASPFATD